MGTESRTMISIREAKEIIEAHIPPPQIIRKRLTEAYGDTLAQDVHATQPSPACNNSAMDGFAIRRSDVVQAETQPVRLRIIGESRAGSPFDGELIARSAVRINTGAHVPSGADAVMPIEDCDEREGEILIAKDVKPGQHIRKKGEEFETGRLLLKEGTVLQPPQVALLAFLGVAEIEVYRPPQVGILVTGSELRRFDERIEPCQVRDSNSPALEAAVRNAGGEVVHIAHVGDDAETTTEALARAAEGSDFILITGGVSVGPHDHVKEAASRNGFEKKFWKVKQKPGKPFFFAVKGGKMLFGLPGNPVSALMNYSVYIDPILRQRRNPGYRPIQLRARMTEPMANRGVRTRLVRVSLDESQTPPAVRPVEHQGSHMISSLTASDGYIIVDPGQAFLKNEEITFFPFPWRCQDGIR